MEALINHRQMCVSRGGQMVIRKGSVTHRDVRQPTTNGPHKKQITAERERESRRSLVGQRERKHSD